MVSVYYSREDKDVTSLISTLLSEIVYAMSEIPQKSVQLIIKYKSGLNLEADLSEALYYILTHLDNTYIMINGLDEWSLEDGRRSSLLQWIARLDEWNLPYLHVLITSQYLPDIKKTLSEKCALRIDSGPNILIHVRYKLHKDHQLAKFDHTLKAEVEECLITGSDEV